MIDENALLVTIILPSYALLALALSCGDNLLRAFFHKKHIKVESNYDDNIHDKTYPLDCHEFHHQPKHWYTTHHVTKYKKLALYHTSA